jgi:dihydrofolate reductase
MGRLVVTEYISVDGVVEAPSGTESFERVGWTDAFTRGPEGDRFADKFNSMPKYVISSTLKAPAWNNTTVLRGDVVEEVTTLKEKYEGDIVVHGSPRLAQTLIENDLVDAIHLQVYPIIVGAGKRLFADTSATKRLRLAEARTVGDGVHILIYEKVA